MHNSTSSSTQNHSRHTSMLKDDCTFCQLIRRKLPVSPVFEDALVFAFMNIAPLGRGHVLLIPKYHAEVLGMLPENYQRALFAQVPGLMSAQREAGFGVKGINVLINDGKAANQTVPHVHIHLIPRKPRDLLKTMLRFSKHAVGTLGHTSHSTLDAHAEQIRSALTPSH